jgi:hypothetical protein
VVTCSSLEKLSKVSTGSFLIRVHSGMGVAKKCSARPGEHFDSLKKFFKHHVGPRARKSRKVEKCSRKTGCT